MYIYVYIYKRKKERSRGVKTFSKQNGGISKQKKRKFIGFRIFCMKSHAALEVLTISLKYQYVIIMQKCW